LSSQKRLKKQSLKDKNMKLGIKKLEPNALLPTYAHDDDAGMDLYSLEPITIRAGERTDVRTGLAMQIPRGFVGLIWDKSGLSNKFGLKILGGVIDAGYRGEIRIGLINLGKEHVEFEAGRKVAQMLIQKVESPAIIEISELGQTSRGEGGFGSTGH
jgi:dUTP pyrophosphatase